MTTGEMMNAALGYAAQGFAVFPVEPRGKRPNGHLAPNGFKDATTDEQTIRRWWTSCPDANIGLPTGGPSRIGVIDIDDGEGKHGSDTWTTLISEYGDIDTAEVLTGNGGRHLYVRLPDDQSVPRGIGALGVACRKSADRVLS